MGSSDDDVGTHGVRYVPERVCMIAAGYLYARASYDSMAAEPGDDVCEPFFG